jgi:WD40 repeat protein
MEKNGKILTVNFNQSQSTFLVGTETGFSIFKTNPLEKICDRNLGGGIGIAVQLFETNFIGLVGGGDNPKFPVNQFVLWNDYAEHPNNIVVEKVEKDKIVAVKLNNDIAAVLTRKNAMLYSLKDMSLVKKVKTSANPTGVCDLSSSKGCVFLCPGVEIGTVKIVDYRAMTERIVSCCSHPLRTITLNTGNGDSENAQQSMVDTIFATTSVEGTLIRVHSIDSMTPTVIREFRRGSDAAEIYSVTFSSDSRCIVVTSNKNTAHIFSLDKDFVNQSSRASFLGAAIGYFGSEWSSFGIEFAPVIPSALPPSASSGSSQNQQQARLRSIRHIGCASSTKVGTDSYRLLLVSEDGAFASHELQFKEHKSIPTANGSLRNLTKKTLKESI